VKPRNLPLFLFFFSLSPFPGAAQQGSGQAAPGAPPTGPWTEFYLIPETVYVGDRARLVIHLEAEFAGAPLILEDPAKLPRQKDIRIHRLELDYRQGDREPGGNIPGAARLLVDFTPYAPGLLEIPPLPLTGGAKIEGFRVNIASVLGSGEEALVLSEPALPLAAPGTVPLILGAALGILLLFLGGIGGTFWARKNLGGILEIRRKRRLVALMGKAERRFRRRLSEDGRDCQAILGLVSAEFRNFLGCFTGYNCLAMSAGEFFALPPLFPPNPAGNGAGETAGAGEAAPAAEPGGLFLGPFFRNLDRLRYSGEKPGIADVTGVLDEVRSFTGSLEKALRGKTE
jgi:hypothetical protein